MKRFVCSLFMAGLCALSVSAAPVIKANGVKTLAAVSEAATLARGAVFTIAGTGLGPVDALAAERPYASDLGGVTVTLTTADGAATVQAYVTGVSETKVTGIVPVAAAAGDYTLTVSFNGETSEAVNVKIADTNFGVLTNTGTAGGMAVASALITTQKEGEEPVTAAVPVSFSAPAKAGYSLVVEAMGLGAVEGPDNDLPTEANLLEGVVILLAGQEIPVSYIGRDGQRVGYDKIAFQLPAENVPTGCSIEFQVKIGDVVSSTATLPIASGDKPACEHPLGISPGGLDTLATGGNIVMGSFLLAKVTVSTSLLGFTIDSTTDTAGGGFSSYDAAGLADFMKNSATDSYLLNPNGCSVFLANDNGTTGPVATELDAGSVLKLAGSGGTQDVVRGTGNAYYVMLGTSMGNIPGIPSIPGLGGGGSASFISPGDYTLTGTGGKEIGAFTAKTKAVSPITWSNRDAITAINRSSDLTVLWTGGASSELVEVTGFSRGPDPETSKVVAKLFVCFAPANAGKLVVPSSVLQQMPAAEGTPSGIPTNADAVTLSALSVVHTNGATIPRFSAPLRTDGVDTDRTTESGVFGFAYTVTKTLAYK